MLEPLQLGPCSSATAPSTTVVHAAGVVVNRYVDGAVLQRCQRCGRVLARVTVFDLRRQAPGSLAQRQFLAARFFPEGRRIAEGPTSTYLVSDRPLAADERECV